MCRQLGHLLQMAERPNLIIRIVPMSTSARMATTGNFHLLRFPEAPTVVYTENLGSDLYLEEPAEIALYDQANRSLLEVALDAGESARLIARLMRTLEEDPDVLPKLVQSPLDEK